MDHEIREGKLCLKEDDLVLYENRDESKNFQSVVRLIIWIVIITIVIVTLLRKLFGSQRKRLFKFAWDCLFVFRYCVRIWTDSNNMYVTVYLIMKMNSLQSIFCSSNIESYRLKWILINLILPYLSKTRWSQKTNSTFVKSFIKVGIVNPLEM